MKVVIKKILLLVTFALLLSLQSAVHALEGLVKFQGKKNVVVFLEVAATDEEKTKGLMNRPSLEINRGMVFVFRPPKQVTFWMKDTLISLDMIFINKGNIVKIVKNAEPNQTHTTYNSGFEVTEVVEVNGGFADKKNISVGDKVIFENISQIDYSRKSKLMVQARY